MCHVYQGTNVIINGFSVSQLSKFVPHPFLSLFQPPQHMKPKGLDPSKMASAQQGQFNSEEEDDDDESGSEDSEDDDDDEEDDDHVALEG